MIRPGVCSVTFRQLPPRQIVELSGRAGLAGIEWGGDVHVPHGDLERAAEVRRATEDAGLEVAAYGSYYRAGVADGPSFESVLETALVLGAPGVRVWAGNRGSAEADSAGRRAVVEDSRRIADLAALHGLWVAYEFHGGTLTDGNDAAAALLRDGAHKNLRGYWQVMPGEDLDYRHRGLEGLLPWLANLHVFQWGKEPGGLVRLPLAAGEAEWGRYLSLAASTGREHYALLEFVRGDDPARFLEDARALAAWTVAANVQEDG